MELTNLDLGLYPDGLEDPRVRNQESFVSSEGSAAGTENNMEKRSPVSPAHPQPHPHMSRERVPPAGSSMVRPDHDMTWTTPSPAGNPPELAGVPADEIFELSLQPEHLQINKPNSTSVGYVQPLPPPQPDGNQMVANLNTLRRAADQQGVATNVNPGHVMSWMGDLNGGK